MKTFLGNTRLRHFTIVRTKEKIDHIATVNVYVNISSPFLTPRRTPGENVPTAAAAAARKHEWLSYRINVSTVLSARSSVRISRNTIESVIRTIDDEGYLFHWRRDGGV